MFTVTAEPTLAFVDAFSARARADATLMALVTRVGAHLSEAERSTYPYVVLGRRSMNRDAGAMGVPGANVTLQVDVWSSYRGPYETHRILSRLSQLFERQTFLVPGFVMVTGSLTCELTEVDDEPDEDKPDARLYHGVQRWGAEIHELG